MSIKKRYYRPIDVAFRDIHKEIEKRYNKPISTISRINEFEVLRVHLDTPETRKLNQQLKITGINLIGNTNYKK